MPTRCPMLKRGVRGLRLARMPDAERGFASPDVLAAYDASLVELARLGAEIVAIALPFGFADVAALNRRIMAAEGYAILHELVDDPDAPLDRGMCARASPLGRAVTRASYLEALRERDAMKLEFAAALDGIDALLTPTTHDDRRCRWMRSTRPRRRPITRASATSSTSARWPCRTASPATGCPTSLQIVCRAYDEATALRIGWAYQNATDYHRRFPPE